MLAFFPASLPLAPLPSISRVWQDIATAGAVDTLEDSEGVRTKKDCIV